MNSQEGSNSSFVLSISSMFYKGVTSNVASDLLKESGISISIWPIKEKILTNTFAT